MEFNLGKYEVLHFGRFNVRGRYTVNGKTMGSIDVQRDLRVQVHLSLQVSTQIHRAAKKA